MRAPSLVIVLTAGVLLFVLIAALWLGEVGGWVPPGAERLNPESLAPVSIAGLRPVPSGYLEQVNRPLFSADRRPFDEPESVDSDQPSGDLPLALVGLFASGSQEGAMVLTERGVKRVAVGERLGTLTLKAVALNRAIFVRGDQEHSLELQRGSPALAVRPSQPAAGGVENGGDTDPRLDRLDRQIRARQRPDPRSLPR